MIYSNLFLDWLTELEGFIPYVYDDADKSNPKRDWSVSDKKGYPTFGIGHLITSKTDTLYKYTKKNPASKDFIINLLRSDLQDYLNAVNKAVKVPLLPHQVDVLMSFCYNVGTNGLATSQVVQLINKGLKSGEQLQQAFNNWVKSKGVLNPTLIDRRKIEYKLFSTGIYSTYGNRLYTPRNIDLKK